MIPIELLPKQAPPVKHRWQDPVPDSVFNFTKCIHYTAVMRTGSDLIRYHPATAMSHRKD